MSTVTDARPPVLDDVEGLAPMIAARAADVEAGTRVPRDLLDRLLDAGCFGVLLPESHGGLGLDLPGALEVFTALARADGSVGWTVMIGATSWADLAGLPRSSFDGLFDAGEPAIFAGAINPSGTAVRQADGFRIAGRWGFVSGCEHCTRLFVNCVDAGEGEPALRIAVLHPSDVTIERTWQALGLRGTGSHHVTVDGAVVPADCTYLLESEERCLDEPIVRVPTPCLVGLCLASVAIGIARGALDDLQALAVDKVPLLAPTALAANPTFQHDLAKAETVLRAATALVRADAEQAWASAVDGTEIDAGDRARLRATATWVADRAASVVTAAYRAAGGGAVYLDGSLQRRLRDAHTLTQHFVVRGDTLTTAGAVTMAQPHSDPLF
jgi:alkylation response protein AidB-like acyl-CoA dehydrogenase